MLPPLPILSDYGISPQYGFLPTELPLERLPDPYYNKWEAIVANLQGLILSKRLRDVIDGLPVLSTAGLEHEAEWRRAYSLLCFMAHSYIWGGDSPQEVCFLVPSSFILSDFCSCYQSPSQSHCCTYLHTLKSHRSPRTLLFVCGTSSRCLLMSMWTTLKIWQPLQHLRDLLMNRGFISSQSPSRHEERQYSPSCSLLFKQLGLVIVPR